jgi:hypothetical protein
MPPEDNKTSLTVKLDQQTKQVDELAKEYYEKGMKDEAEKTMSYLYQLKQEQEKINSSLGAGIPWDSYPAIGKTVYPANNALLMDPAMIRDILREELYELLPAISQAILDLLLAKNMVLYAMHPEEEPTITERQV